MPDHSPEPWVYYKSGGGPWDSRVIRCADDTTLAVLRPDDASVAEVCPESGHVEANAERIVACANACKGLPTEYLEWLAAEDRILAGSSIPTMASSMALYEKLVGEKKFRHICDLANRALSGDTDE